MAGNQLILTRESLLTELEDLILPTIYCPPLEGATDEEIQVFLARYHQAVEATMNFVAGNLDEETFLDTVEYAGMEMDSYLETGEENLEYRFGNYL
jgi:hypothetical protein